MHSNRNNWRPSRQRPVLSEAQLRELKASGYAGPYWLHEDEAAALIALLKNGRGGRR